MRAFIAIELAEEIKGKIGQLIERLKPCSEAVRWVEEKNLHITLKFLGEVKEIDNLIDLASGALSGEASFRASFGGTGAFPAGSSPRVIWVGTDKGADSQREIAKKLEGTLSGAGYEKDERDFSPHITIGRVKEKKDLSRLKKEMEKFFDLGFGEMLVDHVSIMRSILGPKGPKYETLKAIKLKKEENL